MPAPQHNGVTRSLPSEILTEKARKTRPRSGDGATKTVSRKTFGAPGDDDNTHGKWDRLREAASLEEGPITKDAVAINEAGGRAGGRSGSLWEPESRPGRAEKGLQMPRAGAPGRQEEAVSRCQVI